MTTPDSVRRTVVLVLVALTVALALTGGSWLVVVIAGY
jgi:hypothetical protein